MIIDDRPLTKIEYICYRLNQKGLNQKQIGEKINRPYQKVSLFLLRCERKGYSIKRYVTNSKPVNENLYEELLAEEKQEETKCQNKIDQ